MKALKNPYPEQKLTHKRQKGGQRPAVGEQHDSPKAKKIPQDRRWDSDAQKVETPDGN